MTSTQAPSQIFDEIAALFASDPRPQQILAFRPSESTVQRASELLELNRLGRLGEEQRQELDDFERAELLMRLVKAKIRAGQDQSAGQP
jgi:hypothetical protein